MPASSATEPTTRLPVVTELHTRQAAGAENLPGVQLGNKRSARTSRSLSVPAASSPPAALSLPAASSPPVPSAEPAVRAGPVG
jgi:hypothetical protein